MTFFQEHKNLVIIAIVVAVLALFGFFASQKQESSSPDIQQNQMETFEFATKITASYVFDYPGWWDVFETGEDMVVGSKTGSARFAVKEHKDLSLDSTRVLERIAAVKELLLRDSAYELASFQTVFVRELPVYHATGMFNDGESSWRFQEYGVFAGDSKWYQLRGEARQESSDDYDAILQDIFESFVLK